MPPASHAFPVLRSCSRLWSDQTIYDVRFYPYGTANDEQIFAMVAEDSTIVCRIDPGSESLYEILRWFKDETRHVLQEANGNTKTVASLNVLEWTKDPATNKPLLCVAGANPKHIKILDIESGQPVRTLSGHGKGINDLLMSPLSTNILASGAEDNTIRLWDLRPIYKEQPCLAILGGEGHKSPILTLRFHPNGRWLLSGGIDTAICLWAIPEPSELEQQGERAKGQEPMMIYYPHFFSNEVHSHCVDCLDFYGDLIISHCARDQDPESGRNNDILIWKIDGFNSDQPVPAEPPVPSPGEWTRSSFSQSRDSRFRGFQRLLTLSMPYTDRFYHRFGLLHSPNMRPILAMGNQQSVYYFWDLQRLEERLDPQDAAKARKPKRKGKAKVAASLDIAKDLDVPRRSESVAAEGSITESRSDSSAPDREYTLSDRFEPIEPHHRANVQTKIYTTVVELKPRDRKFYHGHFATSQVAWSPDGLWMVAVGDVGMICVFHRDKAVVDAAD